MSDTLPGTTLPDDNNDRTWWGLPCTVTPVLVPVWYRKATGCITLPTAPVSEAFSDADSYHLDQAFPLLMKQLELMLTSGELNPRHQHTVTLYAKGLTCEADTLGSCGYVYMAVIRRPKRKVTLQNNLLLRALVLSPRHFSIFHLCISGKIFSMKNITCITPGGGQFTPVSG